jgi:hypothetical protein
MQSSNPKPVLYVTHKRPTSDIIQRKLQAKIENNFKWIWTHNPDDNRLKYRDVRGLCLLYGYISLNQDLILGSGHILISPALFILILNREGAQTRDLTSESLLDFRHLSEIIILITTTTSWGELDFKLLNMWLTLVVFSPRTCVWSPNEISSSPRTVCKELIGL